MFLLHAWFNLERLEKCYWYYLHISIEKPLTEWWNRRMVDYYIDDNTSTTNEENIQKQWLETDSKLSGQCLSKGTILAIISQECGKLPQLSVSRTICAPGTWENIAAEPTCWVQTTSCIGFMYVHKYYPCWNLRFAQRWRFVMWSAGLWERCVPRFNRNTPSPSSE
jgi:hypothetical protein